MSDLNRGYRKIHLSLSSGEFGSHEARPSYNNWSHMFLLRNVTWKTIATMRYQNLFPFLERSTNASRVNSTREMFTFMFAISIESEKCGDVYDLAIYKINKINRNNCWRNAVFNKVDALSDAARLDTARATVKLAISCVRVFQAFVRTARISSRAKEFFNNLFSNFALEREEGGAKEKLL